MEDATKAFKKFKGCTLYPADKDFFIIWGKDKKTGLPNKTILGGYRGSPRPSMELDPREVKCVECTKPGLFRKGEMTFVGMDGSTLKYFEFKDKANLKTAETMNTYLELYRQYDL